MALTVAISSFENPGTDPGADLAFLLQCGVDTLISDTPRNWLAAPPTEDPTGASPPARADETPKDAPKTILPPKTKAAPIAADLAALALEVVAYAHPLNPGPGAQPVLLQGPEDAALLLLTDIPIAPDSEAGHLITAMMAAIGLKMADIAQVPLVPWPTNGRAARPEELTDFAPFAAATARLARPRLVLALGAHISDALLEAPSRAGEWQTLEALPLLITLSPARLLRSPQLKAQAWAHLQALAERLS